MAFKKDKLIGLSSQTESLKSSKTFLCAIGSSSLNVYSIGDYKLVQTFVDLWDYTTFDVASCTVAYPSNLPLKAEKREDQDLFFMDPEFSKKSPGAKATEIVSKVATGVTSMGEIGIKAFQNYLNPDAAADQKRVDEQDGVIVVRHLKRQNAPIIAHWKPHKHPISHIVFNSSQTLLYTCSTNGKTICAWSLLNSFHTSTKNILAPSCVMTFARGYTTALITDLKPSLDDRWLAVSTSRGTAHLYHIEPKYLVAAVRGTSSQASTIPVTLRVNSRNPLQVARSLLPQSPESLGSSPIYVLKPSSSVDHATSDLGFEDISLDTTKNVFCTAFGVGFKSLKDSSAKYPFVLFDPFGKLCATLIEPVSSGSGSSSFGVPLKFSVNVLIESSVCRTVDFKEVFSNRVASTVAPTSSKVDPTSWPAQIEISTCRKMVESPWENPLCQLSMRKRGSKGELLEKLVIKAPARLVDNGNSLSNQPSPTDDDYCLISTDPHPENVNNLPSILVSKGTSLLSAGLESLKSLIKSPTT